MLEPVTLAAMKEWLRITSSDDDNVIASLIAAARLTVEAAAGQILMSQKWRLVLDAWPANGMVRVPLKPLIGCESIRVYTGLSTAEILDPENYDVDMRSDPPRIVMAGALPSPARASAGIEIDLTAGYGAAVTDVPADLCQAVKRLTAHWYERRGDEPGDMPPWPPDVVAQIAARRTVRIA